MTIIETTYEHIVLDDAGDPRIEGTTMKVIEVVLGHRAYGWSAAELHFQHPYLSLGQIYSALAYYWDHQDQFDQEITQRQEAVAALRKAAPLVPFLAHIRHQR